MFEVFLKCAPFFTKEHNVILEGKRNMCHTITPKEPVLGRVCQMANARVVTPASQHEFLCRIFGAFLWRQNIAFPSKII